MGEKWRVTVERYVPGDGEFDGDWHGVIGLDAPREQLARFAPGVVAEALGVQPAEESSPNTQVTLNSGGVVTESVMPDGIASVKRKRRTKAEIAADEAAAMVANAVAAEVPVSQEGVPEVPSPVVTIQPAAPGGTYNPFQQ